MRTASTARKTQETLDAAANVIAARMSPAMMTPTVANGIEFNLMVSEKVAAFSEAGAAVAAGAQAMAGQSARYAVDEAAAAGQGMVRLTACKTPAEMMMVQGKLMADFFSRGLAYGMGLNTLVARTGDKALSPVHKTVTDNHKRLNKR
jgi:hypothetical protein